MKLPPGTYRFAFRLKCSDNTSPRPVATLEVRASGENGERLLASKTLRASDFKRAGEWQVFSLTAEVRGGEDVRALVRFHPGVADLWCDWIRVQPAEPVGPELLELPVEFWLDELISPIRAKRGLEASGTRLRGAGTSLRPFKLLARGSAVLEVARGRRLVLGPSQARFERYDARKGAWVEQASAELIESWRSLEKTDKIRLEALERYPLGPSDLDVLGLDADGRLKLTEVGVKAASLDALAISRLWGGEELLLCSEVFADKGSWRLRPELTDGLGRPLTSLVLSSNEIGPDGIIKPGAVTVEKLAENLGVELGITRDLDEQHFISASDAFVLAKTATYEAGPDVRLELLSVSAELRANAEEAHAYLRVTWQAGDGEEQIYFEAETEGTGWTRVGHEEPVLAGFGQPLAVRFYLRTDTPPPEQAYTAEMRNTLVRVRAYGRRKAIPI